ncbi:MAG: MOSC domain-containing protein [Deltaproteobacteria bacterium]|jgi:MOSC domain-containing protein YiiM|nr:MOSC domain-containing protein [Deltaproteobacteria bacterium]
MVVESLNIGLPKKEVFYGKEITTGMCKRPVSVPLRLKKRGFAGDGVADTKNHGGVDKAVCVYSLDHYPYWEKTLGIRLPAAAFGENLSVSNLAEDTVCIGDVFQLGTAAVQITQPRQPCNTLATRYGRNDLVKLVVTSGFTGFYFRVLQEGIVEMGTSLVLMEKNPQEISVAFANRIFHHDRKNREGIEAVLGVSALSKSWQSSLQRLREKCI